MSWRRCRLDWLATEERGATNPAEISSDTVFHYSIPALDEIGDGRLEQPEEIGSGKLLLSGGEVLISKLNPRLPRVLLAEAHDVPTLASTEFIALRPGPEVDERFLRYWLGSEPVRQMLNGATMSVTRSQQRVRPDIVTKTWLTVPSKDEQSALADYLDRETARIDALIAKYDHLEERLRERLNARISQETYALWVGAGGALPDQWRVLPLRRCFDVMDYGIGERSEATGPVAVLGMGNVEPRKVVREAGGYVDLADDRLLLHSGDLLFNRTNSVALVGKVALWLGSTQATTFASYLVRLRASPLAEPRYLNYLLNTEEVLTLARAMALPSIGQANLNPNRYGSLRIPLPPLSVQHQVVGLLEVEESRTERLLANLQKQLLLLVEHRQALITAAVTGELDSPGVAA